MAGVDPVRTLAWVCCAGALVASTLLGIHRVRHRRPDRTRLEAWNDPSPLALTFLLAAVALAILASA